MDLIAALRPTPRAVLNRTWEAWLELESNPVNMAYGNSPTLTAADDARTHAADLLGCTADEILITRSTTDAMNSVAQGMSLRQGDRVLTVIRTRRRSRGLAMEPNIDPGCSSAPRMTHAS